MDTNTYIPGIYKPRYFFSFKEENLAEFCVGGLHVDVRFHLSMNVFA